MNQEFRNNVLNLLKQYISDFEKFKEKLPNIEEFYSSSVSKKIIDKNYENALKICNKIEMKTMKDNHELYLNCDVSC